MSFRGRGQIHNMIIAICLMAASLASAETFSSPAGHTFTFSERSFLDRPLYLYSGIVQGREDIVTFVGEALDRGICECKKKHPEIDNDILDLADRITYRLVNHHMFYCGNASYSGYCYGLTNKVSYVKLAFYPRWQGKGRLPYGTKFAPHTYIGNLNLYRATGIDGWYGTRKWVNWGEANQLMPALCHELEHVWSVPGMQSVSGVNFVEE